MHWCDILVWKLYQAWKIGYVQIYVLTLGRPWMLWIPRQGEKSFHICENAPDQQTSESIISQADVRPDRLVK